MARRSRGFKNKTRKMLTKSKGDARVLTVNDRLRTFNIGDYAAIKAEASMQEGMPHPRYQGVSGTIVGQRGRAYIIEIKDGGKTKRLISNPEHLKLLTKAK